MTLNRQERTELVKYRLEKAQEALEQVKGVCGLKYWNLAANRLYYTAYYACSALLIHNGIETSTHKGVRVMMGLHFFKPGLLSQEFSELFGRLFEMRQSGDYEDKMDWKEEDIIPIVDDVQDFVSQIMKLIQLQNEEY